LRHYSFKPGWIGSLGCALLVSLFITLGFWQLHRADAKKAIMAARAERARDAPVALQGDESSAEDMRYRRVEVSGDYDAAHQFLLDNQIHGQQPGYHVLTPLRIAGSGAAILINRGWIPVGPDRNRRPDPPLRETRVQLSGVADRFPGVGFKLEGAELPTPGWPAVVQVVDPERLAERLGYPVLPYQVLLDETAAEGYARDWKQADLAPEKNLGYALQWFLFAGTAVVLYLWHGFRAGRPTNLP
jgi:surfeit locus 1 family protein